MKTRSSLLAVFLCVLSPCFAQQPTWTQKFPVTSPQSGHYSAMAYDSAHSQVVLFGGAFPDQSTISNETWTWDGSSWTKQSPAANPPARVAFGMAYDSARAQVVIFGGAGPGNGNFFTDTWVWDGINWTQKVAGPGPRLHVGMTYDAARQQVVLFGGSVGAPTPLGDTWVWDGTTWTQKFPAHNPGLRSNFRMAYDAARAQVVLFGGWNGNTLVNETWVWDGVDWTQKFPVSSPSPRQDHAIAYDANLTRVVLFSGIQPNCTPVDNLTWTWEGTNWTQESPATSPPGRGGAAAAYDSARGQVVLFGGNDCSQVFTDTWVWGTSFAAQVQPPINADGSSVFNSIRGVVPVKFALTVGGSPTCDLLPATISLFRTSGGTLGSVNESVYTMGADNGSNFRISGCQYVYNLGTSLLGVGTYQVNINIGGTGAGTATFGLN